MKDYEAESHFRLKVQNVRNWDFNPVINFMLAGSLRLEHLHQEHIENIKLSVCDLIDTEIKKGVQAYIERSK